MRVANIIIAHKNPDQLMDLINQFPSDYYHNWLHIDARSNINEFKHLLNLKNVTLLPRRKVVWAGFSFIRVTVEALRIISKEKEKFSYYNLMSGMDFPIRSTHDFHKFLNTTRGTNKREFFHIAPSSEKWPIEHRYEKYHLNDWTIKGRHTVEKLINLFVSKREYFNGKLTPYGFSAWFTASDEFIKYALKYFDDHPDYLEFLKTVWCPDELVFNSLIMGSPFKDNIADGNLRYIDWAEGGANPKILRMEDLDLILNSDCFLARKFDNLIDPQIIKSLTQIISKK